MSKEQPHDLIDETIHQRTRLAIMATLAPVESMDFNDLKAELGLTDGNLSAHLTSLELAFRFFNYAFDNYLLRCGPGDDFVVCTDSQQGGLAGGYVDNFHYVDGSTKAIHFNSICTETPPSVTAMPDNAGSSAPYVFVWFAIVAPRSARLIASVSPAVLSVAAL